MFDVSMLSRNNYVESTKLNRGRSFNESYLSIALDALQEMNNIYTTNERILYKSVLEAGSSSMLINESFKDFTSTIKDIIDKFLEIIKSLFSRFVTNLNSIVKSDKHLKKHKTELYKFSTDDEFDTDGYMFTNITNSEVPKTTAYSELKEFNLPSIVLVQGEVFTKEILTNTITGAHTDIKNGINKFYDTFRGKVLNRTVEYSDSEYSTALFNFYRNEESNKPTIKIDREFVVNAYERFSKYDETISAVKKIRDSLEREYNAIKTAIKNTVVDDDNVLDAFYSAENRIDDYETVIKNAYNGNKKAIDLQLDLIQKLKIEKITNMCKIHTQAFAAKLDAIKDCYIQDKKILYKSLNKTQKVHECMYDTCTESTDYEYVYDYYSLTESYNQHKVIRSIIEADYFSRGIIPIQESVVDVIKAGVQKIIATIKKIWAKFISKASEFVMADKSWLDNNKKIILNRPWKEMDVEMYSYDEDALTGDKFKIPAFNYDTFVEIAKSDSVTNAYISKYFPSLKQDEEIRSQIIDAIRGEETKEFKTTSLPIDKEKMYKFCINYEAISKNLNKDITVIEKAESIIKQEIGKVEAELNRSKKDQENVNNTSNNQQMSQQAQKAQQDADKAQQDADKAQQQAQQESTLFSTLYESTVMLLNEDGLKIKPVKTEKNTGGGTTGGDTAIKGANINTGARDNSVNKVDVNNSIKSDSSNDTDSRIEELNKIKDGVSPYFKCDADIIMAKLTICQKMYKDYMALLRAHVNSHADGTKQK